MSVRRLKSSSSFSHCASRAWRFCSSRRNSKKWSVIRSAWSCCVTARRWANCAAPKSARNPSCAPSRDIHMAGERLQKREARWWSSLVWPVAGLALLLLFNLIFTEGFFHIEVREGRLYGVLIDILNHGSKVMLLSLGMALVIATGGVDLSVGAVMAIAGAVAAQTINRAGVPFPVVVGSALIVSLAAGCWNRSEERR